MKSFPTFAVVFVVPFLMAIGCLMISDARMEGFQDCRHIYEISHTIPPLPLPDNCADARTLLDRDILTYAAAGLFIIPFVTGAIIFMRAEQAEVGAQNTIKIL